MRNAALIASALLAACAPTLPASHPVRLPFRLVDGLTGAAMSTDDLLTRLRHTQLVIVGEEHPNPSHHGAQTELVELGLTIQPELALGLEMVPISRQPALDRWREDGNDAALVAALHWEQTWGYPFGLYQPALARVRQAHGPVYALNAEAQLARKIARQGLGALDDTTRANLPVLMPGPPSHRAFFNEAMAHNPHHLDDAALERYYTAQLLWDETMAQRAAEILLAPSASRLLVVLAGAGHARRDAVAERAQRRGVTSVLTVLPVTDKELAAALADHQSDVLWVIRRR